MRAYRWFTEELSAVSFPRAVVSILKLQKEEDLAVQIRAGWLPRLSLGSAARKPKQGANAWGKGLGVEGAFEGEGRWSYPVFSLLFS